MTGIKEIQELTRRLVGLVETQAEKEKAKTEKEKIESAMQRAAGLLLKHPPAMESIQETYLDDMDLSDRHDRAEKDGQTAGLVCAAIIDTCTTYGAAEILRRANEIKRQKLEA